MDSTNQRTVLTIRLLYLVESVCFDMHEELVVAGSTGGTLKLWDLDQQKGNYSIYDRE